jgi:hypothetical protein
MKSGKVRLGEGTETSTQGVRSRLTRTHEVRIFCAMVVRDCQIKFFAVRLLAWTYQVVLLVAFT